MNSDSWGEVILTLHYGQWYYGKVSGKDETLRYGKLPEDSMRYLDTVSSVLFHVEGAIVSYRCPVGWWASLAEPENQWLVR